jgi:hypothetical protein
MILRPPLQEAALNFRLAALVVEQDTIPKPDGLGDSHSGIRIEPYLNNIEQRPKQFDAYSTGVRKAGAVPV